MFRITLMVSALAVVRCMNAQFSVSLDGTGTSPGALGERVTWGATVNEPESDSVSYRFRARRAGEDFRMIQDYGPASTFDWASGEDEGVYEIEVTARDNQTGATATQSRLYEVASPASGDAPMIVPTSHPLVYLYSAPECAPDSRMRVEFQSPDGAVQSTATKACLHGSHLNFYLSGLRQSTDYTVKHILETGSEIQTGPQMTLTTSDVQLDLPARTLLTSPEQEGLLLYSMIDTTVFATDLSGNLAWYYPGYARLTRTAPGGLFVSIVETPGQDQSYQGIRVFDVAGITVQETNAARVNEQLTALGKRPISSFHHEAFKLPDGQLVVLALVEEILTDIQGPGEVDVLGDMIIVLDQNLQVVWVWDAFDHLDVSRKAIFGQTCAPGAGGCSPFYRADKANDWLHSNSVQPTPDGNFLVSMRHQDWVIKIDYNNGNGTGGVLWRLGKDGDFAIDSADAYPWFSHQHDARFIDSSTLVLFDNGNTRRSVDSNANSRGQVIRLDEQERVARLEVNADLGGYSSALGSAQQLPNGNYHFNSGFLPGFTARSLEVDGGGNVIYGLGTAAAVYRSFRLQSLSATF